MADQEVVRFRFPKELGGEEVVLRELTAAQELDADRAARAAGGGGTARGHELLKRALVSIGGKTLDWNTADPDEFLTKLGSKKRIIMSATFNKAFVPTDEEIADSLATMTRESVSAEK